MKINLHRTFSPVKELDTDPDDWAFYFSSRKERLTWSKLHENIVTVVVGEAGIGKTIEFQNEVNRLREKGKVAFFVELNQLLEPGNWEWLLDDQNGSIYKRWLDSSDVGHFFLDAVDEARLTSHAALKRALKIVLCGLKQNLERVQLIISSRWTDWSHPEVQNAVIESLVEPIENLRRQVAHSADLRLDIGRNVLYSQVAEDTHQVEAFVVSLNPLSVQEAKRFAVDFGLLDALCVRIVFASIKMVNSIFLRSLWSHYSSCAGGGERRSFAIGSFRSSMDKMNCQDCEAPAQRARSLLFILSMLAVNLM